MNALSGTSAGRVPARRIRPIHSAMIGTISEVVTPQIAVSVSTSVVPNTLFQAKMLMIPASTTTVMANSHHRRRYGSWPCLTGPKASLVMTVLPPGATSRCSVRPPSCRCGASVPRRADRCHFRLWPQDWS